jgi:hypothetical protein
MSISVIAIAFLFSGLAFSADLPSGNRPEGGDAAVRHYDVYCDFRCPFCAKLFTTLLPVAQQRGVHLDFQFRHLPLHAGAKTLATYFEATQVLYPDQPSTVIVDLYRFQAQSDPKNLDRFLEAFSVVHGFDHEALKRQMHARDVTLRVAQNERDADALHVFGTPTVFADGHELPEMDPKDLALMMLAPNDSNADRSNPGTLPNGQPTSAPAKLQ